jgi:TolB protein
MVLFIHCKNASSDEAKSGKLKIAYNVLLDEETDDYEIFVMNLDGTDKKNISNSSGVDWVYYANGDKLYFLSDRDTVHRMYFLYESNANGENIRKVSDMRMRDSWFGSRKGGKELIVNPHPTVDSAFYIIDLQGKNLQKINTELAYFNDPVFTPHGNQIVFRGSKQKFKKDNEYLDELYLINTDGSGLEKLTTFPEADTTAAWHRYHAGPPQWIPNTNEVSYISFQNNNYSIFTVDVTSKNVKKITDDNLNHGWHAWSTDGNFLVYDGSDFSENPKYDIYLMDKSSGNSVQLTMDTLIEQGPVFVEARE